MAVELAERSYPIYVTAEGFDTFGLRFREHCGSRRAVIITDNNVGPIYAERVAASLSQAGVDSRVASVAGGESSKRMAVVESLYDQLFDFTLERTDAIVALGGGVVGDLAGFVAATYKRGLDYVQAPTSLLAMVDSSVGGKTGINHPRGKNMIGAFHQPRLVYAAVSALETLPPRELSCGLTETVKHAVIRDQAFFTYLEGNVEQVLALAPEQTVDLVVRNCRIKAAVVSADERETGLRGILNFGHTIGHALETVWAGKDVHHGEAVALGMTAAARIAINRNMLKAEDAERIMALLAAFGLPLKAPHDLPINAIYAAMQHDKKVHAGKIKFILPTGLGSCTFVEDLTEAEMKCAIGTLDQ